MTRYELCVRLAVPKASRHFQNIIHNHGLHHDTRRRAFAAARVIASWNECESVTINRATYTHLARAVRAGRGVAVRFPDKS